MEMDKRQFANKVTKMYKGFTYEIYQDKNKNTPFWYNKWIYNLWKTNNPKDGATSSSKGGYRNKADAEFMAREWIESEIQE